MGRHSEFTQEYADAICERLVSERSLRSICTDEDMPHIATVFRWLAAQPSFREQYARAREAQGHVCADTATDEAMTATDPAIGRLRYDAMRWKAGKLHPKAYGERQTVEHTDPSGNNPFGALMEAVAANGRPRPGN